MAAARDLKHKGLEFTVGTTLFRSYEKALAEAADRSIGTASTKEIYVYATSKSAARYWWTKWGSGASPDEWERDPNGAISTIKVTVRAY